MITEKGKYESGKERLKAIMASNNYSETEKVHLAHREGLVEVDIDSMIGQVATYDAALQIATENSLKSIQDHLNA